MAHSEFNKMKEFFEYLEDFKVLVCLSHHAAVRNDGIERHLSDQHGSLPLSLRKELLEAAQQLDLIDPKEVVLPKRQPVPAFTCLGDPFKIYICSFEGCQTIYTRPDQISRHVNKIHGLKGTHQ